MKRRQFLLSSAGLAALSLAGCGGDGEAALLTRRNVTGLSAAERQAFVDTLHGMKRTPSAYRAGTNAYDYFVSAHVEAFDGHSNAHMCAGFLPWHREFLMRFEQEMRRVSGDPAMCLPYWDWQQRGSYKSIFTDDFLGGNGDPTDLYLVKTGAFREGLWAMGADFDDTPDEFPDTDGDDVPDVIGPYRLSHRGLTRCYNHQGRYANSLEIIDDYMDRRPFGRILNYSSYDAGPFDEMVAQFEVDFEDEAQAATWQQLMEDSTSVSMRKYLERRLHNQVHAMIGGQMTTGSSPNDPVFFLHHCNVDRLWALWQRHHGDAGYPTAQQSPTSGIDARLDIYAETVRVEDTFDLAAHSGVRYED